MLCFRPRQQRAAPLSDKFILLPRQFRANLNIEIIGKFLIAKRRMKKPMVSIGNNVQVQYTSGTGFNKEKRVMF